MKKLLFLLTICMCFNACNNGETERLAKENEELKAQLSELNQLKQNQLPSSPITTAEKDQISFPQNTETIAKTKAQQVVKDYLMAGTAKERAAFVLNPKEELPRMEKTYKGQNLSWSIKEFKFLEDKQFGDYTLVTVEKIYIASHHIC